jgi:hypothetical protein
VRLKELDKLKHPVCSSGFETATFMLVSYCLNQLRYRLQCNGNVGLETGKFSLRQRYDSSFRNSNLGHPTLSNHICDSCKGSCQFDQNAPEFGIDLYSRFLCAVSNTELTLECWPIEGAYSRQVAACGLEVGPAVSHWKEEDLGLVCYEESPR